MIFTSSIAPYGPSEELKTESSLPVPQTPYGASKLEAESVLAGELGPTEVDFASLRFANVYGPRQDWRGEGGVVAIFVGRALSGKEPTILGSGEQTRDFIYVGDVVDAVLAALEAGRALAEPGPDGPAYNISTASETPIGEVAAEVIRATGFDGVPGRGPERPGDVERSALSPAKARETLGWSAGTSLQSGIDATVRWFRSEGPAD